MDPQTKKSYHQVFSFLFTILVGLLLIWMFDAWDDLTGPKGILVLILSSILGPFPGYILSFILFPFIFPEAAKQEAEVEERREREKRMRRHQERNQQQKEPSRRHSSGPSGYTDSSRQWTIEEIEKTVQEGKKTLVNVRDRYEERPIEIAIKHSRHDLVEKLIGLGARVDYYGRLSMYSPLSVAAKHSDGKMIHLLCSHGAKVSKELRYSYNTMYMGDAWDDGVTALHFAAKAANLSTIKALVEEGADVNATTSELRQTPLFKVMEFITANEGELAHRREIIIYLMEQGADPSINSISDNNLPDLNRLHQFAKRHGFTDLLRKR